MSDDVPPSLGRQRGGPPSIEGLLHFLKPVARALRPFAVEEMCHGHLFEAAGKAVSMLSLHMKERLFEREDPAVLVRAVPAEFFHQTRITRISTCLLPRSGGVTKQSLCMPVASNGIPL